MNKRRFLQALLGLRSATLAGGARARTPANHLHTRESITLKTSPAAGFQYYTGKKIWPEMKIVDRLTLYREPKNRYDKRAVEVYWGDYKLGYMPRNENIAVAAVAG